MRIETNDKQPAWWPQLYSFSVGLKRSPDLAAAGLWLITLEQYITKLFLYRGLDAIKDVIYNLETYDITTVRASSNVFNG